MNLFVEKYLSHKKETPLQIVDLGSANIGGTYRDYFNSPCWKYMGVDLAPGPNIDIILSNPYNWRELRSHCADVFISGQTFEHIEFFWLTMLEIARVLKPGGLCCIIAPSTGPIHRYPVDCWRFYPDGFAALARYADLEIVEILHEEENISYPDQSEIWRDLVLIARKKDIEPQKNQEYERTISLDSNDSLTKIIGLIPPNSTILELGPATGYLTRHLTNKLGCIVDCIEVSPSMAEAVRPFARTLIVGDLNTLDFRSILPNDEYDIIIAADVLEHLSYSNTVVEQAYALLKENGKILVSVPNIAHASVIGALCQGDFPYSKDGLLDKSHTRFFTRRSICHELTQHGFMIEKIDPVCKAPHETELGDTPGDLPIEVETYLSSLPDAMVYQFIISGCKGKAAENIIEVPSNREIQAHYVESLLHGMDTLRREFEIKMKETVTYYEQNIEDLRNGLEESQELAFSRQKDILQLSDAFYHAEKLALERDIEIKRLNDDASELRKITRYAIKYYINKIMRKF